MGTTWHVTYIPASDSEQGPPEAVLQAIEELLEAVNVSMSTYQRSSEISHFNHSSPEQWFTVTPGFLQVLQAAMKVGDMSGGAYDVTIGPVVNLWGFGPDPRENSIPDELTLNTLLGHIGQDKLRVDEQNRKILKSDQLSLDFSSIAKGYGVDQVADWFVSKEVRDFLVEIGGEMRLAGKNPRGENWRIAIEQPDALVGRAATAISLSNEAVATSGDYRNYFEIDKKRYSHTIDPRTGYPIAHDLVSVTVVHPQAMLADAWATAFMVLGAEQAMKVALEQGLAVYFIQRQGQNYSSSYSPQFESYLEAMNQVSTGSRSETK